MQYIDCFINPISRQVSYPGAVIVQRDTNVEALRFHFSLQAEHALEDDSIRVMVKTGKEIRGFNAENVRVETNDGGDEELVFEHTITRYETEVPGQINVSVCGNQISGNTITEAWHTLNMSFQVGSSVHTDSDEGEDSEETQASNAEKIAALQTLVDAITSGRPIPVDLKSKMVDTSAIYLYTGNEQGEQHNYWYYHDGTSWVPGSEYGGITVDDELSATSENPVQNKVIKANFDQVNGRLQELNGLQTVVTGTGRGIGGYSYECEFVPGQKYVITNTSDSIRFNAKTWNDGADVEQIKNAIMPGESVTFVPTLAAPYLRLYFSDAGMGSFEVKSGEITEMKDTVEALGTTVSGLTANVETLSANVEKMQYSESVEYESGLYSGPVPAVGDTYDKAKTSNTGWICKKVPVTQGDRVIFYGAATASTPLWVYTTTGGTVIAVTSAIQYTSENPVELDITDDGFLYLNARTTYGYGATHYINDGYGKIEEQIEALREEIPVIIPPYPLEFTFDVTGIPAQDNFSITSHDPQDIYDLYDGLMTTYPAYITRVDCSEADSILGVTRPSYLADYPIYLYKFSPKVINTTAAIKRKIKMMVLTGLHSNEKWNVYNVYRIMKYICENWKTDKNAATIRTFVEFWIIPMVNPWGWANAGTGSAGRVNGNGVNLNRNAPASTWRQTSEGSDYSGPSAGSEYETKIWLYYHDQLQPDVFIDQHTPGMPSTGYFGVLEADITNTAIANIGDVMCREISNHLLKVDENVPDSADTVLFDLYSDTNPGQASRCALEHGTPYAFLFEMADSSKWSNGVLTESTVTGASSGIQIREQMQNIYGCWQRLLSAASK